MTSRLESLPPELISSIAEYLFDGHHCHKHSPCLLRLVSRTICTEVENVFLRKYFTFVTVDTDFQSLSRLTEISKHPIFSQAVRGVGFSDGLDGTLTEYAKIGELMECVNINSSGDDPEEAIAKLESNLGQDWREEVNLKTRLIAEAFARMPNLHDIVIRPEYVGQRNHWKREFEEDQNLSQLFCIVMSAVGLSEAKILRLEFASVSERQWHLRNAAQLIHGTALDMPNRYHTSIFHLMTLELLLSPDSPSQLQESEVRHMQSDTKRRGTNLSSRIQMHGL